MMTDAHKALLAWLQWSAKECPKSGARNAGNRPYYPSRFMAAVRRRAEDGEQLVAYMREKIYEEAKERYRPLIDARCPELTAEAVVLDGEAPWASLFTDEDRATARDRLRKSGLALTPEHEREMLARMAAMRAEMGLALNAR